MNVGERIRYYRNVRKMSQEALALSAELNPAFIGHLERGLKSPTVSTLEKLTKALNITMEELFAESLDTPNKDIKRAVAVDRITVSLNRLSEEELCCVSEIIHNVVKFKQCNADTD